MAKKLSIFPLNRNDVAKIEILFEIMRSQPHIKQKEIAGDLGITIQAISRYFKKFSKEGLIEVGSERADYRLTSRGVALLHENIEHMESYVRLIKHELKVNHAWLALATYPVKAGEQVGLITKEGIFYTVPPTDPSIEAVGTAIADANPGEDLGLEHLNGMVKLKQGRILIVKLPSIRRGGSRAADLARVRSYYDEFKPDRVGVIGAVGRAVLNKLGLKADFEFGISHSAVVAASRGLNVFVLVVGRMAGRVIEEIDDQNLRFAGGITYEVKDAQMAYLSP